MDDSELMKKMMTGAERLGLAVHWDDLSYRKAEPGYMVLGVAHGGHISLNTRTLPHLQPFVLAHEIVHEVLMHPLRSVPAEFHEEQANWAASFLCRLQGASWAMLRGIFDAYGGEVWREPDDAGESSWAVTVAASAIAGDKLPELPYGLSWARQWCKGAQFLPCRWAHMLIERHNNPSPPYYVETQVARTSMRDEEPWYETQEELEAQTASWARAVA